MNNNKHKRVKSGWAITASILFLIILYFPWGGVLRTGIPVPEHLGWGLFGVFFLLLALRFPNTVYCSSLLAAGGFLLTLPLLWMSPQADSWHALTRVAAMWGGGVLLWGLAGVRLKGQDVHILTRVVMLVGLFCALTVFVRVFEPVLFSRWLPLAGGGWATGGYLQPDLMALLISVALVAALHMWLFQARIVVLIIMTLLAVALVLCLRLPGLVSLVVVCVLMLLAAARGLRRRLIGGFALILMSSAGTWLLLTRILHQHPILTWPPEWMMMPELFHASLMLLRSNPITGIGYGQFAGSLPDGMMMAGLTARWQPGFVTEHPGSELLYWITEGGLPALVGVVLLLLWGSRLLIMLWHQARRVGGYGHFNSEGLGLLFCALPLVLMSLTAGTPWYHSPLHYLLFIVLIAVALAWLSEPETIWQPSRPMAVLSRSLLLVAGLAVIWFAVTGTRVAIALQDARQTSAKDVTSLDEARRMNPWYLPDEVRFALTVHQLQQFNITGDKALLASAEPFFKGYLTRHPDPNVYSMYITVLDKQGKSDEAERVYEEGQHRVPWDQRFAPDTPASQENDH